MSDVPSDAEQERVRANAADAQTLAKAILGEMAAANVPEAVQMSALVFMLGDFISDHSDRLDHLMEGIGQVKRCVGTRAARRFLDRVGAGEIAAEQQPAQGAPGT